VSNNHWKYSRAVAPLALAESTLQMTIPLVGVPGRVMPCPRGPYMGRMSLLRRVVRGRRWRSVGALQSAWRYCGRPWPIHGKEGVRGSSPLVGSSIGSSCSVDLLDRALGLGESETGLVPE
jgi:hypothetical protein